MIRGESIHGCGSYISGSTHLSVEEVTQFIEEVRSLRYLKWNFLYDIKLKDSWQDRLKSELFSVLDKGLVQEANLAGIDKAGIDSKGFIYHDQDIQFNFSKDTVTLGFGFDGISATDIIKKGPFEQAHVMHELINQDYNLPSFAEVSDLTHKRYGGSRGLQAPERFFVGIHCVDGELKHDKEKRKIASACQADLWKLIRKIEKQRKVF